MATDGWSKCAIYLHDGRSAPHLHPDYTPCDWEHHQYSQQLWTERVLARSPSCSPHTAGICRASHPAQADLIFIAGHDFGLWCAEFLRPLATRNPTNVSLL